MTVCYLHTSAAMKLVIEEPESAALVDHLVDPDLRLTASWLLHTEMHCAAGRHPEVVSIAATCLPQGRTRHCARTMQSTSPVHYGSVPMRS